MMGLLDLEKVISLTGFKSQVLHNLNHRQHKKKNSVKLCFRRAKTIIGLSLCSPDDAVLQPAGDHVDRHALRLVGEGHRADDLSAVHVSDQIAVDRPQAQVTASTHWDTKGPSSIKLRTKKQKTHFHRRRRQSEASPESQTVAMSPVVSLADTAVTGLLWPVRLCT